MDNVGYLPLLIIIVLGCIGFMRHRMNSKLRLGFDCSKSPPEVYDSEVVTALLGATVNRTRNNDELKMKHEAIIVLLCTSTALSIHVCIGSHLYEEPRAANP